MGLKVGKLFGIALLALALVAAVSGGSADAKKGGGKGVGKSVDSSEIEDGTVACADIAAAVFPNGCPDDDSGAGAPPAAGGVTRINSALIPNTAATIGTFAGLTVIHTCDVAADNEVIGSTDTDNSSIGEVFSDAGAADAGEDDDLDIGDTFDFGDNANNESGIATYRKGITGPGAEITYRLDENNNRCQFTGAASA